MIKIGVIGNGSVEVTENENSVTLTATPVKGYEFKHYLIGSEEIKENPYSVDNTAEIVGDAVFYQSINSLLKNCIQGIDVSGLIPGILMSREVEYGADLKDLDKRTIDLCRADIYYESTNIPSSRQMHRDADGGWSHDEGGFTMDSFTKNSLIAQALAIYTKYEDDRAEEVKQVNENKRVIVEYNSSKAPEKAPEKPEVNAEFLGL